MYFWLSRGSILHKLWKILLSGKSTHGSRETELYSCSRRMFRESRMCLQAIHYIYATKGQITGMIAQCRNSNCINPGRDRVRSKRLRQPRLALFSIRPKHVVIGKYTQGISFSSHSISTPYSLSDDSSKQKSKFGYGDINPNPGPTKFPCVCCERPCTKQSASPTMRRLQPVVPR